MASCTCPIASATTCSWAATCHPLLAWTINQGTNFSLSYAPGSREETDQLFAKLSEGGTVSMPLGDMFWGSYFGSCTDKFGINWMLNFDKS